MPLLNQKHLSKKKTITLRLEENLLNEIRSYQQWAGIDRINDFFEESARYILEKDKDWVKKEVATKTEGKSAHLVE